MSFASLGEILTQSAVIEDTKHNVLTIIRHSLPLMTDEVASDILTLTSTVWDQAAVHYYCLFEFEERGSGFRHSTVINWNTEQPGIIRIGGLNHQPLAYVIQPLARAFGNAGFDGSITCFHYRS